MLTDKREILHIKSYFSKHANEEIIVEIFVLAIVNFQLGKSSFHKKLLHTIWTSADK